MTNTIYVANACGHDDTCQSFGTVSVIDGATDTVTAIIDTGGFEPFGIAVNAVTKIYAVNVCGTNSDCATGTVAIMNKSMKTTTSVNAQSYPFFPEVDAVTNKIYVVNAFCNKVQHHGITCNNGPGSVTTIDGATGNVVNLALGDARSSWPRMQRRTASMCPILATTPRRSLPEPVPARCSSWRPAVPHRRYP